MHLLCHYCISTKTYYNSFVFKQLGVDQGTATGKACKRNCTTKDTGENVDTLLPNLIFM